MTLVDFDSIKKTSVLTCMVHVGQVSWNVIILNNINDNTVNSKQYTLMKTSNTSFIIVLLSSMLII